VFYEKIGFRSIGGNARDYLIMQNDASTIGLFQGAIEKNLLTFNPGWDRNGTTLSDFDDIREIQRVIQAKGIQLDSQADETTTGPASLTVADPDGNQILIDQHVPRPPK
jgi:hypothetical protein